MTAKEFVKKHNITATNEWSARNPHMEESHRMNNYKTTLHIKDDEGRRRFTLYYSKGLLLEGEPTAEEVIETLALDTSYIEYGLEDFISNLGYEYPRGKKVFETIEKQAQKLYRFLGNKKFLEFKTVEEAE